jgi:eukaryotic-like serine/threonine-protein kinase
VGAKLCPQCGTRYDADNRFCTLDGATLVAENPADSLTGNVLADRYLIDRKLGEGGMGEVYLAEHIRMKRKVAVKVMRAWLTKDPAAIGRFHREAENASQITHPNVAGVYDFGETDQGLVYLAMEFVEGESLTTLLDREKVLNHIRASDIVSQPRTRWPLRTPLASCTATSSPTM